MVIKPTEPAGAVNRTPVVLIEPEWSPSATAELLYYAESFEGGKTANGNTFAQAGFSAARCDIPLNTLIQVRYGDKSVVVKANDRPNCTKHPDIVDLTTTAFSTLAPLSKGRLDGSFVSLGTVQNATVKNYLPEQYFDALNVQLNPRIPNLYEVGETLVLKGQTTDNSAESLILVITPSGTEISYGQESESGSQFTYHIPLNEAGTYRLVLASGRSFSGARALAIEVLNPSVLE